MNGLDLEGLLEAKKWAEREIERIEVRRANAPMWTGFFDGTSELLTKKIPAMMAGPTAAVRESVLRLEESLRDSDERQAKAEEGRQERLARARARTNALQEWLEALS